MSIRSPKDWRAQLGAAKEARRRLAEEAFEEPSITPEQTTPVLPEDTTDFEPLPVKDPTMSAPANEPSPPAQPTPPAVPAPPLPGPILQIPDPVNNPVRPRMGGERRNEGSKPELIGAIPPSPVPLSDEQQAAIALIYLVEQYEAALARKRERRMAYLNQVATLLISVVGIVGGTIAIRNGLYAATERNRK